MAKSGGQHYALVDKQGLRVKAIGGCGEFNRAMGLLGPVWDDSEKTPEGDWWVHVKSWDSRVGRIWGEWVRIDQAGKVVSHKRKLVKEVQ